MVLFNFSMIFTLNVSADGDEGAFLTQGSVLSNKDGNIFMEDEALAFGQKFTNNIDQKVWVRCTTEVYNENDSKIWERRWEDFSLEGNEEKTVPFTLTPFGTGPVKCGLYTLKVVEVAKKDGEDKVYSSPRPIETKFSICKKLTSGNLNPQFGYNQGIVREKVADYTIATPLMLKSGAKWHREGIEWGEIEQSQGVYSSLSKAKNKLQNIKNSGLETVCILKGANPIYTGYYTDPESGEQKPKAPSTDEAIEAFADYCTYIATELDGLVDHFEIWNEWNVTNFNPSRETPETYAKVLKAAYEAIKAVNSDYKVLGCAISGFDTDWIGRVLTANGGEPYMDILSLHDYEFATADTVKPGKQVGFPESEFIDNVESVKTLLEARGLGDLPMWLTEAGFSTYDNSTEGFVPGCSDEEQLNAMVMLHAVNKSYGLFDKIIQYCLYDGNDATHIESNWGVLDSWTSEGTPASDFLANAAKPAYVGLTAMNYFIGGNTDFVGKTADEENREYVFEFYNKNLQKPVALIINGGLDHGSTNNVNLDATEIELYDKYGNFIDSQTSGFGVFEIEASTEPLYAVATSGSKIRVDSRINYNTGIATVSGKTELPNDLVTLMLVTGTAPITSYDASRIEYFAQTTSDANGNFSFTFAPEDPETDYQVYVNSKSTQNRNIQDAVFTYSAAGIKLFKNGTEVTALSQLSADDSVDIEVGGTAVTGAYKPKIIVAQYKDNEIVSVDTIDAIGDASKVGNEIEKSFTVSDNIDKIKVMYWKMNSMATIVRSFVIQ